MKVKQLRDVLRELEAQARKDRRLSESAGFAQFAKLIEGDDELTVVALAKRLKGLGNSIPQDPRDRSEPSAMRLLEFMDQLDRVVRIYAAGGARAQSNSMRVLVDALPSNPGYLLIDYTDAVGGLKLTDVATKVPRGKSVDLSLVQRWLAELTTASADRETFEVVVARLADDRKVVGKALTQIVNAYSGHEGGFKNKKAAVEWLKASSVDQRRFVEGLRAGSANQPE